MKQLLIVLFALALPAIACAQDKTKPVKVFILAGQSNMEGKAKISVIEAQLQNPATRDLYKQLKDGDKWIERDDVWIRYHEHKGKLSVGYHNPKAKTIGPELGFGLVVGDHYAEQVLLIKSAWGGRSVFRDFRSPSAGLPAPEVIEKMLADAQKQAAKAKKPLPTMDDIKKPFGASYREMFEEINSTLANLKTYFPDYAGQGYELAGFIWFQGWNDMINAGYTAEYAANMNHFIKDVRKDLKAPKLPFVIGEMGVDGLNASANVKKFKAAQAATLDVPEFRGNVALVKTDGFWDLEADTIFRKGWQKHLDEWNKVGSDYPYHYLGSPKTMLQIGRAFGNAILELRSEKKRGGQ